MSWCERARRALERPPRRFSHMAKRKKKAKKATKKAAKKGRKKA